MANPDDALQDWFGRLPFKVKRQLAKDIKAEADGLARAIDAVAPRGPTGNLAVSVKVRRKRNDLDLEVTAGGDLTTKSYDRSTDYSSAVVIDGRDNRGKSKVEKGSGESVSYDYALANEFGTTEMEAQPFFYPTYREKQAEIRQNIEAAVEDAISKA